MEKRARVVHSLRGSYRLKDILAIAKLPKATYMYWQKRMNKPNPDLELEEEIKEIRLRHKDFGYRRIYGELKKLGIDVIMDDRGERPGVMFSDWELIGIPHRIVIGERGLKEGKLEYQGRRDREATAVAIKEMVPFIREKLSRNG